MPISESNICTKLMEFQGRGNKDSNIFYTDSTLLQNFAKFCLWLNWYTTPPPRDKPPPSAALHFKKIIDTDCFRGVATSVPVIQTPDVMTCVEHNSERGWNSTQRLDRNQFLHGSTVTGSSRPNSARQQGMVDRNPDITAAGRSTPIDRWAVPRVRGGGKKTKRLHKKKRGKRTLHCKKNQTRPLRKKKVKPTKKK